MAETLIDWENAFAYYASLPAPDRTYKTVAAHFGVSVRTVETHGGTDHWKQRLRAIEAAAAGQTNDRLVQARVEEIEKMQSLISATLIAYAQRLRDGQVRVSPADLERLNRLSLQLVDELDNPQPQREPSSDIAQHGRNDEHAAAVVDVLAHAGALAHLGLQPIPAEDAEENAG